MSTSRVSKKLYLQTLESTILIDTNEGALSTEKLNELWPVLLWACKASYRENAIYSKLQATQWIENFINEFGENEYFERTSVIPYLSALYAAGKVHGCCSQLVLYLDRILNEQCHVRFKHLLKQVLSPSQRIENSSGSKPRIREEQKLKLTPQEADSRSKPMPLVFGTADTRMFSMDPNEVWVRPMLLIGRELSDLNRYQSTATTVSTTSSISWVTDDESIAAVRGELTEGNAATEEEEMFKLSDDEEESPQHSYPSLLTL
jgi:hypothetical protein